MANNVEPKSFQEKMEVNIWALLIVLALALSVGGIVEIVPLFTMDKTMEQWRKTRDEQIVTVDTEDIMHIVSKWTGVPLTSMEERR